MTEWIKCEDELPPCDGRYQVTNHPESSWGEGKIGTADYDGYGFMILGAYRNPLWWKPLETYSKKYGKQK